MSSPPPLRAIRSATQQRAKRTGCESVSQAETPNAKRIKTVTQACKSCRKDKAKCDGTRPKCGPCVHKGRDCGYEGEVGQSRQAAMKDRLEVLEKLFDTLQNEPPEEAVRLLQRIRSADGLSSVLSLGGEDGADAAPLSDRRSNHPSTSSTSPSASGRPCGSLLQAQRGSVIGYPPFGPPSLSASSPRLSSTPSVSSRVSRDVSDASRLLVRPDLPNQALTTRAVESFFSSTGQLFHVFSRGQVASYLNEIYGSINCLTTSVKKAVCCVASVAAVGVQYKADDFDNGLETIVYEVARRHFVDVFEDRHRPLDSIKVCTLLAMYNIMNKATVSVAYVEVALGMYRRHSLSDKDYVYRDLTTEEVTDYRTTWRCLIFFSTWLSSTLGYIPSEDVPLNTFMPIAEAELGRSTDIIDTVQVEMTKISILNAHILRMHLASEDLTALAIESIMADLQDWYRKLPPAMALATLGQSDLPNNVRRSIYYVHLLYLGAIMLVYRRVASQFNRIIGVNNKVNTQSKAFEQTMLNHAEEGVLAAKASSRVLGLLLTQTGCFKRCWIIIFQSYTSCVVLLHCVAQKQVHKMDPSSWEEDLAQAQTCLDALEYCGTLDPVAVKFYERLSIIFQTLSRYAPTPEHQPVSSSTPATKTIRASSSSSSPLSSPTQETTRQHPGRLIYDPVLEPHPFAYLFTIPANGNSASARLSVSLLRTLSRPYDNPNNPTDADAKDQAACDGYAADGNPWEQKLPLRSSSDVGGSLDWDMQGARSYRWNRAELRLPDTIVGPAITSRVRFLGSTDPSGWSTASF
ncbi:hypothetical protein CONLIGDRAFT_714604 [Coniochaeta ligniaria NRRL 30616]|uniref:Zn(2)-C6 fungal-type domain-containing protein n=1 Tax=Coniochaeta ligniaria NRRL 30616 TaxID=1408157 RepID=A0A1J7IRW1_9PEZI|nr:hypothetical protein CONLIGDRAFT_714604 [Coniochaeta ligniaria NRRL 30616]